MARPGLANRQYFNEKNHNPKAKLKFWHKQIKFVRVEVDQVIIEGGGVKGGGALPQRPLLDWTLIMFGLCSVSYFQELQLSVNKLSDRVAPWLKLRMTGDPTVSQILGVVDKLVFDDGIAREKVCILNLINQCISRH